jgi:tetratricopeptide (TPR) repeat protein
MPKKPVSRRRRLTRKQQRDIDIEIGFLEGLVRRDPEYVEALEILGDGYTKRGRFEEGLAIDQQLVALRPTDSGMCFNLACSLSLTKRLDEAVNALRQAIQLGYRDFEWLLKDPDLRRLREDERFAVILALIEGELSQQGS